MNSKSALTQVHLVDYVLQGSSVRTDILPEIAALFNPMNIAIEVMPEVENLENLENLVTGLLIDPGIWLVLFYDRAEQAVEDALLAGTLPREALAQWEQGMKVLLSIQRKHRRSVLLVDRAVLRCAPQIFARELCAYLDIDTPKTDTQKPTPRVTASIENVIAVQTVAQSLHARRLNGDLNASSLPMSEELESQHCDVDAAFQSYTVSMDKELAEGLKAENNLLFMQLAAVQQELEINLLELQYNVLQPEAQLHQCEDEVYPFLQSASWRITGPLLKIKDLLSGLKKH